MKTRTTTRTRKNASREAVERRKDRSVEFLRDRDTADADNAADKLADESVEHFAQRKHIQLDNPRRGEALSGFISRDKRQFPSRAAARQDVLKTLGVTAKIESATSPPGKEGFWRWRFRMPAQAAPWPWNARAPRKNQSGRLVDAIRHGDRVTIVNRFGQQRSGRAVMRSPAGGWTLNMGGPHGTPGIATDANVVKVKKTNSRRLQTAAKKRQAVKRQLRKMGVAIPETAVYDLSALRQLRKRNSRLSRLARSVGKVARFFRKRKSARTRLAKTKARRQGKPAAAPARSSPVPASGELVSALRNLGFGKDVAVRSAQAAQGSSFDQLFRSALTFASGRRQNAGQGYGMQFHGAFKSKEAAAAKEKTRPGSFVRSVRFKGGDWRYVVMSRMANPRRKKNKHSRPVIRAAESLLRKIDDMTSAQFAQGKERAERERLRQALGKYKEKERLKKAVAVFKANPSRQNQAVLEQELRQAAALYENFHGEPPAGVTEIEDELRWPENYTKLGDLVSLCLAKKFEISFSEDETVAVAADPAGRQLYLLGGNQDVTDLLGRLRVDGSKAEIDLGELSRIEYITRKRFDKFVPATYYHDFGEETGQRPRLRFDRLNKTLHVVGGAYKIRPEGIVN